MVKGYTKKVVTVKFPAEEMFEEALFVVRGEGKTAAADVVAEAERIAARQAETKMSLPMKGIPLGPSGFPEYIGSPLLPSFDHLPMVKKQPKRKIPPAFYYLAGSLSVALAWGLCMIFGR